MEEIEVQGTEIFGVKPVSKPSITPQVNNSNNTSFQSSGIEPIFRDTFRTYSNYACGIDVRYPADWKEIEASKDERSDSGTIVTFFVPEGTPQDFAFLSISMADLLSTKTLRGITIKTIDTLEEIEPKFNLTELKPARIADLPAHQIIYTSGSEDERNKLYKSLVMWTIEDDRVYRFRFDSNNFSA